MPYSDEQLAGHRDEHLHLAFLSDYGLVVGEPVEEAVLGAAGSPCTLDDGLAQEHVTVGNPA